MRANLGEATILVKRKAENESAPALMINANENRFNASKLPKKGKMIIRRKHVLKR